MAGKFDFTACGAAKLKENIEILDLCVLRFATWAAGMRAEECALCGAYLSDQGYCGPCPIMQDGHRNCEGTPYDDAAERVVPSEEMCCGGGARPKWLTTDACASEVGYLLRLRGKLSKALRAKAAVKAKKAAKAKAARKKAARG